MGRGARKECVCSFALRRPDVDFDEVFERLRAAAEARTEGGRTGQGQSGQFSDAEEEEGGEEGTNDGESGGGGKEEGDGEGETGGEEGGEEEEQEEVEEVEEAPRKLTTAERARLNQQKMLQKHKQKKGNAQSPAAAASPASNSGGGRRSGKKGKAKWVGGVRTEAAEGPLDYSAQAGAGGGGDGSAEPSAEDPLDFSAVDSAALDDWSDLGFAAEEEREDARPGEGAGGFAGWLQSSGIGGMLASLSGGHSLTREDVAPVMRKLQDDLVAKNVAHPVAMELCRSVEDRLVGQTLPRFTMVATMVRDALREALERILTPQGSVDVLAAARAKADERARTGSGRPYVIVFTGVNGVGKSTSLAKVCFHLKANNLKVMIAACDTFRSAAIEQLQRHSDHLGVPLFKQGYNKDAGKVAQAAVRQAAAEGIDVVCVDTAGRMQNNERYMRELAALVSLNEPDLVLFVGEALVGNDGVDQLREFNRCLIDFAPASHGHRRPRGIDGIFLTKFDTVDDKVGAAVSMVHSTGLPVIFLGTGQKYTNLKRMNVPSVVRALLG